LLQLKRIRLSGPLMAAHGPNGVALLLWSRLPHVCNSCNVMHAFSAVSFTVIPLRQFWPPNDETHLLRNGSSSFSAPITSTTKLPKMQHMQLRCLMVLSPVDRLLWDAFILLLLIWVCFGSTLVIGFNLEVCSWVPPCTCIHSMAFT
jgi:hypothetical protein